MCVANIKQQRTQKLFMSTLVKNKKLNHNLNHIRKT